VDNRSISVEAFLATLFQLMGSQQNCRELAGQKRVEEIFQKLSSISKTICKIT
jgi:hypothetical protein